MKFKAFFLFTVFLISMPLLFGRTFLEEGEEHLQYNRPQEALIPLRAALQQEPSNDRVHVNLGISYMLLKMYDKAIQIMKEGSSLHGPHEDLLYYNIAKVYLILKKDEEALKIFNKALQVNPDNKKAILAKSNLQVRLKEYQKAIDNYSLYLLLDPESSQKESIEKMIALLNDKISQAKREEEAKRLAEERRKEEERLAQLKKEEEERRRKEEEERRKKEEEERQKALLNDILNELDEATEDTTNLSADSEGIEEYHSDTDIYD